MKKLNYSTEIAALAKKAAQTDCDNEALKFSQSALNLAHICSMCIQDNDAVAVKVEAHELSKRKTNRKTGWLNIYIDGTISFKLHATKADAVVAGTHQGVTVVDTVEVAWNE